jgi:hypothetical protein
MPPLSSASTGLSDRSLRWTPCDLVSVERIVEMTRTDSVFGQEQRTIARVPDRERPIPDHFGEAVSTPFFVSGCDDDGVCGTGGQRTTQFSDQLRAVVQTAVPSDDSARRGDVRLRFET